MKFFRPFHSTQLTYEGRIDFFPPVKWYLRTPGSGLQVPVLVPRPVSCSLERQIPIRQRPKTSPFDHLPIRDLSSCQEYYHCVDEPRAPAL